MMYLYMTIHYINPMPHFCIAQNTVILYCYSFLPFPSFRHSLFPGCCINESYVIVSSLLIVDEKSDPRLLGKIYSLTGVFYFQIGEYA